MNPYPSPGRSSVLKSYMVAHRVDPAALRPDGRLILTFDARWRVQVRPLVDGRLQLSAAILDISRMEDPLLEDVLLRLCGLAAGLVRDHHGALALDEAAGRLLLQAMVPADVALHQFEAALGDFVNTLAFWSASARAEAARR